jgi:phage antirepressor YoqD-like protein
MPYIHIDIEEIYDDLDCHDKENLVEWLKEDGYCTIPEEEKSKSAMQELFEADLAKIKQSYLIISAEDAELINQIAKRY